MRYVTARQYRAVTCARRSVRTSASALFPPRSSMYSPQHTASSVRPARTRLAPSRSTTITSLLAATFAAVGAAGCSDVATAPTTRAAVAVPSFSMATWQGTGTASPITSALSASQCVDANGATYTPGTRVSIYTCNGGANQQWTWQATGEIRYGSMCLDAAGGAGRVGDALIIWTCNGGANQHWVGTTDGMIQGINGLCIDIPGANTATAPQLVLATCSSAASQRWNEQVTTTPAPALPAGTLRTFTSTLSSSQCVDANGATYTPGTRVSIYTCNGGANQQWTWQATGEIRYGSMCLDAAGGAGKEGDVLIIWTCNGGANQHWVGTTDGMIQGMNGRCIDIPGGNTANAAQLVIKTCRSATSQRWDQHAVATVTPPPVAAPVTGSAAAVLAFMAASNTPNVASVQARGGAYARYEADFASYANTQWAADSTSFDANFYDRAMIYYVWWARTGDATYLDRANKLAIVARTYLESTNYYPQAYNMMIDGVALHALVTGDQRSATTVAKVADGMGNPNGYWYYVAGNPGDGEGDSRGSARVLSAVLDAYLLHLTSPNGYNYASILTALESRILTTEGSDGAFRWPLQCNYNKPFMSGMIDDALIRYYTSFQADARIVPAIKRSVDFMWNNDWVPSANGLQVPRRRLQQPRGRWRQWVDDGPQQSHLVRIRVRRQADRRRIVLRQGRRGLRGRRVRRMAHRQQDVQPGVYGIVSLPRAPLLSVPSAAV